VLAITAEDFGSATLVAPALTVADAVIGGVASIAAMFRNDYAISAREMKIDSTPLIASVASLLASKGCAVVVDGFELADKGTLLTDFNCARKQRRLLDNARIAEEHRIAGIAADADILRARIKDACADYDKALAEPNVDVDLNTLKDNLASLRDQIVELDEQLAKPRANISMATAAIASFDAFVTAVTSTSAGAPYPPLASAAIREGLRKGDGTVTHVLFLEVDTAGAETVTVRSRWRPRARFVGGLHVSYLLLSVKDNCTTTGGTAAAVRQLSYNLRTGEFETTGSKDICIPVDS
jgi:hypothetical protein